MSHYSWLQLMNESLVVLAVIVAAWLPPTPVPDRPTPRNRNVQSLQDCLSEAQKEVRNLTYQGWGLLRIGAQKPPEQTTRSHASG